MLRPSARPAVDLSRRLYPGCGARYIRSPMPARRPTLALLAVLASAAPPPAGAACAGDCDGDGAVEIGELVTAVGITLGSATVGACPAVDDDRDGTVRIAEMIKAVGHAVLGCLPGGAACPAFEIAPAAPSAILDGPSVTAQPDGEFVVAFARSEIDDSSEPPAASGTVRLHRYGADDTRQWARASPAVPAAVVRAPRVATISDGGTLLSWNEGNTESIRPGSRPCRRSRSAARRTWRRWSRQEARSASWSPGPMGLPPSRHGSASVC